MASLFRCSRMTPLLLVLITLCSSVGLSAGYVMNLSRDKRGINGPPPPVGPPPGGPPPGGPPPGGPPPGGPPPGGPPPGNQPTKPLDALGRKLVGNCLGNSAQCPGFDRCDPQFLCPEKMRKANIETVCFIDTCSGCKARLFQKITEKEVTYICSTNYQQCEKAKIKDCPADLCKKAKCPEKPSAYCVVDNCDKCAARFYKFGNDVTDKCIVKKDDYTRPAGLKIANKETVDIMMLIDGGWWVTNAKYKKGYMEILKAFVDYFRDEIDRGYFRVGLWTFDWIVRNQFCFDKYTYGRTLKKALEEQKKKQLYRDATLMKNTWEFAKGMLHNKSCGARTDNVDMVFMIWDGVANYFEPAQKAAIALKNSGALVFCIGINPNEESDKSKSMCTEKLTFHAKNFGGVDPDAKKAWFAEAKKEIQEKLG